MQHFFYKKATLGCLVTQKTPLDLSHKTPSPRKNLLGSEQLRDSEQTFAPNINNNSILLDASDDVLYSFSSKDARKHLIDQKITGNIIPQEFYNFLRTSSGRIDSTACLVLAEILYWYRPKQTVCPKTGSLVSSKKFYSDAVQISYDHMVSKLHFSTETIRKTFKRLEEIGLIRREFRTVKSYGTTCNNVMFIHLNCDKLSSLMLTSSKDENSNPNNDSWDLDNKQKIDQPLCDPIQLSGGRGPSSVGDKYKDYNKNNKEANSYGLLFFNYGFKDKSNSYPSSKFEFKFKFKFDIATDIYSNSKQNSKNRMEVFNINSSEKFTQPLILPENPEETSNKDQNLDKISSSVSARANSSPNFFAQEFTKTPIENSSEDSPKVLGEGDSGNFSNILKTDASLDTNPCKSHIWSFDDYKRRPPKEFLPLDSKFCDLIRLETGKNFPDSYFEDVVVKFISQDALLDKRVKWSKKYLFTRLIAWAIREFKCESQILFEFGMKSNSELEEAAIRKKEEKKNILEEERMIARYEGSRDISPIGILKRKIAGSLAREEAAILLTNANFAIDVENKQIIAKITSPDQKTEKFFGVLEKTKPGSEALNERGGINWSKSQNSRKILLEKSLENIAKSILGEGARASIICDFEGSDSMDMANSSFQKGSVVTYSNNEFYSKIQRLLYNKFGEGVYRSWFSKLEFYGVRSSNSIGLPEKTIYAVAPTKFMSDWVKTHYLASIEKSIKEVVVEDGVDGSCSMDAIVLTKEEFKKKLLSTNENSGDGKDFGLDLEIIDTSTQLDETENQSNCGKYSSKELIHDLELDQVAV